MKSLASSLQCRASLVVIGLFAARVLLAQNLLPNPGFEGGTNGPTGWRIGQGEGQWSTNAHTGRRSIAVTGDGKNSFAWRTGNLKLQPGGVYRLRFAGRRDAGTSGGCDITGLSRMHPRPIFPRARFEPEDCPSVQATFPVHRARSVAVGMRPNYQGRLRKRRRQIEGATGCSVVVTKLKDASSVVALVLRRRRSLSIDRRRALSARAAGAAAADRKAD
jgi:hypothetical protein